MEDEKLEGANSRDMYRVYIFTLRPLYLKGKIFPFSIVWYDEMFVQNFRWETKV
jgi:hypothetical protein